MVSRSRSDDHREPLTMTTAGQQTSPRGGKRRLLVAMLLIVFGHSTLPVAAANLSEMTGFGSNPGNLRMWTYIPEGLKPNAPLVVALHGCSQSAADYDDETGWVQYADHLGFALLLPEQKPGFWFGNHPLGCFNWYYRGDQQRDGGEVLSIIQMIDALVLTYGSDPSRVYVTGLSAGGAMTATLLATYPERFAGGAIIAGVPFGCSRVPDYVPQWAVPYWSALLRYKNPLRCLNPGLDLSPRHGAQEHATPPNPMPRPGHPSRSGRVWGIMSWRPPTPASSRSSGPRYTAWIRSASDRSTSTVTCVACTPMGLDQASWSCI